MIEPMSISPNYTVEDWKALTFSNERDWQKGFEIFEDRIFGRFLKIISAIENRTYAGFAVLALDCLLIETLQQFRKGEPETPPGNSKQFFVDFLTETSFGEFFTEDTAEMFYDQIRCGILHQAEVKSSSLIRIREETPFVSYTKDGEGLIINRKLFHKQLVQEFEEYVTQLQKNNPPNNLLRENFKKKMDYICRVPIMTTAFYFAYGSNMKTGRLRAHLPSAKPIGRARLLNKRMVCNKKSKDGSGKANLVDSPGDVAWGVLYEINPAELDRLDRIEGGYRRTKLQVWNDQNESVTADVYISTKLVADPIPYDWYKKLIIAGACEHQLPKDYLEYLEQLPSKPNSI